MKSSPLLIIGAACLLACDKPSPAPSPPAPEMATEATKSPSEPAPSADDVAAHDTAATALADAAQAPDAEPSAQPDSAAQAPDTGPSAQPDGAALRQCKDILVKSWASVKPVIVRLGVRADEALETAYVNDQRYLDACVTVPQDKRDCLLQSEHPVAALSSCNVNEPKRVLWAFDFGDKIPGWPSTPLTPDESAALTRWIVGTWRSNWESAQEQQRWVVGPEGKVESAEVVKRGAPDPKALVPATLTFKQTRKLEVAWKDSTTTQSFAFFKESEDVFYASSNGLYDAYPVADEKHFMVRHGWEYILYDEGRCEVVFGTGASVPGTCTFAKDGARRLFKTEFQRPGAARPSTATHVIIGKHFLVDSMVEAARFVRQK